MNQEKHEKKKWRSLDLIQTNVDKQNWKKKTWANMSEHVKSATRVMRLE